MRVGVHVAAFNLYGGRALCGQSTAGWRWLDIRELVQPFVGWSNSVVDRVVSCTARVDGTDDPTSSRDQAIYLEALAATGSVDHIEKAATSRGRRRRRWLSRRAVATPSPVCTRLSDRNRSTSVSPSALSRTVIPVSPSFSPPSAREEKGSDVNVATHLLHVVLSGAVDGAVVVSNDSDLSLPLQIARRHVSVGTINPTKRYLAGALRGSATEGPGRHWWKQLSAADFLRRQLPDPAAGKFVRPAGW